MQWVPVATQPVEQRLVLRNRILDDDIGFARRGHVDLRRRTAIATPAAGAADERSHLALDQKVAIFVERVERGHDERALPLVEDVLDRALRNECGLQWKGSLELDVLLSVKETVEPIVQAGGGDAFLGETEDRVGARNDRKRGQGLHAATVAFVD